MHNKKIRTFSRNNQVIYYQVCNSGQKGPQTMVNPKNQIKSKHKLSTLKIWASIALNENQIRQSDWDICEKFLLNKHYHLSSDLLSVTIDFELAFILIFFYINLLILHSLYNWNCA